MVGTATDIDPSLYSSTTHFRDSAQKPRRSYGLHLTHQGKGGHPRVPFMVMVAETVESPVFLPVLQACPFMEVWLTDNQRVMRTTARMIRRIKRGGVM